MFYWWELGGTMIQSYFKILSDNCDSDDQRSFSEIHTYNSHGNHSRVCLHYVQMEVSLWHDHLKPVDIFFGMFLKHLGNTLHLNSQISKSRVPPFFLISKVGRTHTSLVSHGLNRTKASTSTHFTTFHH